MTQPKLDAKKRENYIDNAKFTEETIAWIAAHKIDPSIQLTPYLGRCIMMIATRLCNAPCFNNYSFKEDLISDGIENCVRYFDRYDPEKISKRTGKKSAGAFPYFTQYCWNSAIRRITTEKLQMHVKQKFIAFAMDDIVSMQEHESANVNEEITNILRDMSGGEYLEYDVRLAAKKEKEREARKPKQIRE